MQGGAGIAARRLASLLLHDGMRVGVAFRSGGLASADDLVPLTYQAEVELTTTKKRTSQFVTLVNREVARKTSILFTPLGAFPGLPSIRLPALGNVIHAHNLYNLLSAQDLVRLSRTHRVVATLHDERLLTSGCHYSLGCERARTSCRKCPQSRMPNFGVFPRSRQNQMLVGPLGVGVTFIAPSHWMRERALKVGVPAERVVHIPNPIDTQTFTPSRRAEARRVLGLSMHELVIGWQPGKGNQEMARALRRLVHDLDPGVADKVRILVTGSPELEVPFRTIVVPSLMSEEERANFWAASDIGISATAMDNYPNVVTESLAVGTPFVIADVGGAAEAVKLSGGGIVVPSPDGDQLALGLKTLIEAPGTRTALSIRARSAFSGHLNSDRILRQVLDVYAEGPHSPRS